MPPSRNGSRAPSSYHGRSQGSQGSDLALMTGGRGPPPSSLHHSRHSHHEGEGAVSERRLSVPPPRSHGSHHSHAAPLLPPPHSHDSHNSQHSYHSYHHQSRAASERRSHHPPPLSPPPPVSPTPNTRIIHIHGPNPIWQRRVHYISTHAPRPLDRGMRRWVWKLADFLDNGVEGVMRRGRGERRDGGERDVGREIGGSMPFGMRSGSEDGSGGNGRRSFTSSTSLVGRRRGS